MQNLRTFFRNVIIYNVGFWDIYTQFTYLKVFSFFQFIIWGGGAAVPQHAANICTSSTSCLVVSKARSWLEKISLWWCHQKIVFLEHFPTHCFHCYLVMGTDCWKCFCTLGTKLNAITLVHILAYVKLYIASNMSFMLMCSLMTEMQWRTHWYKVIAISRGVLSFARRKNICKAGHSLYWILFICLYRQVADYKHVLKHSTTSARTAVGKLYSDRTGTKCLIPSINIKLCCPLEI